jgi:hypothetical protein
MKAIRIGAVAASLVLALSAIAPAQMRIRFHQGIGPDGTINLPYIQADSTGNQWIIYPGGWIRQNGPQPLFGQAETLNIAGMQPGINSNRARVDPKTGEVVIENMQCGTCTVTRRILLNPADGMIRFIDIFKNIQGGDQTVNVMMQSNLNFGVSGSAIVSDPQHADSQIGWVGMTGLNRAAVEMYAGKGSKVVPTLNYEQGNSVVQANIQLNIPAGKSVAVMHLLGTAGSIDQGQQMILEAKESKMMATLEPEIRREIVNFGQANSLIGDYEILRGDIFDVIELRSGDQIKGTLKEDAYKLDTFYGPVNLPKDQVVALLNVGQYRPRQLVVMSNGEVFGGNLESQGISMELSSGQVVQVPLMQISRVGYRKGPDEPEEWTFDKPFVLMRSGDRVDVEMPAGPIDVTTRYGLLHLDPQSIASILFQSDDNGVHEVLMTDGSKFAGLVATPDFEMKLSSGYSDQPVKFSTSGMIAMQLAGKVNDTDDSTPTATLANQDILVGTLQGALKLDTAFDTLQINAPEVKHVIHSTPGSPDVQITLWDNSTVSGQLEDQTVECKLLSGPTIDLPVALLQDYNQPLPTPSATMIDKIKASVTDLSADDWKARDQAEATLVAMGTPVISVLKDLRASQPPEAQERIDAVLKQLANPSSSSDKSPAAAGEN